MKSTVKGRYRFEVVRPDGSVRYPLGGAWVDNIVTNAGLDSMFTQAQAVGDSTVIAASGYGFLVPMAWCRLSLVAQSSDPTVPGFSQQSAASSRYIKTFPAIAHNPPTVVYPDTVNSVAYSSDATWIWADFQRTFVFTPSGVDRNWNGMAVSWTNIPSDPVFSRITTPATITVEGDEELRVIYQLRVALPKAAAEVTLANGGFTANGDIRAAGTYAVLFGGISTVGSQTGSTTVETIPSVLRGYGTPAGAHLLTNSAFPADDASISPTYAGATLPDSAASSISVAAYTTGNFYRDITASWGVGRPVALETDVRSIFLGTTLAPTAGIQWLMDANQSKDPTKTLSATFRIAWARP